jgi:hypothetical protein
MHLIPLWTPLDGEGRGNWTFLLLESGDTLLLETGHKIALEG